MIRVLRACLFAAAFVAAMMLNIQISNAAGALTTYEAETFSEIDCLTIIGWHKQALAMCGAREVTMREEICRAKGGAVCRYGVEWLM